jgi:murein DD-endopeptidase MepM/ murein hydrolase activator NlpD
VGLIATRVASLAVAAVLGIAPATRAADAIRITTNARSIQPGEVVLFTASAEGPIDALRAHAFDRDLPTFRLDATTWQATLGIDLDTRVASYPVSFDASLDGHDVETTITLAVRRRVFPTRTLKVDAAFVNPPAATLRRITSEAAELTHLWEQSTPDRLWSAPFVVPVPGRATSSFGTRSIFNGERRQPHGGADFLSPTGTPIHAPNSGRVVVASDLYFTGNTVVIDHGLGVYSLLAHMSVIGVQVGDSVTAGQVVGEVGATGRVTGPHLHWAVMMGGARVDPLAVLAILGGGSAPSASPTRLPPPSRPLSPPVAPAVPSSPPSLPQRQGS